MTVFEALQKIHSTLKPILGEFALPESEHILEQVLGMSRTKLYASSRKQLTVNADKQIEKVIRRRICLEPLAYIFGSTYFFNREFLVTSDVLIPRPDTEILVEQILEYETSEFCTFLDIGIGSGIIAAILTETHPKWYGVGIDKSMDAIMIAQKNIRTDVHLLCGDILSGLKPKPFFDFIVSNPPYLSDEDMRTLEKSVHDFEPFIALHGGYDGLDFYRNLALNAKDVLRPNGKLYCEIGYNQKHTVPEIFEQPGWLIKEIRNDLGDNPRTVMVEKSEE